MWSKGGDHALIVKVKGHSVANEILRSGLKAELLVNGGHCVLVEVDA